MSQRRSLIIVALVVIALIGWNISRLPASHSPPTGNKHHNDDGSTTLSVARHGADAVTADLADSSSSINHRSSSGSDGSLNNHKARNSGLDSSSILIDPLPPAKSFLPATSEALTKRNVKRGTRIVRMIQNGMQPKWHVQNLAVRKNEFYWIESSSSDANKKLPDRIYLPDGQVGPMKQNHKYTGHAIHFAPDVVCSCRVTRPTVFLYRMSGHSTYHLWENNLGPFYQTLQDFSSSSPSPSSSSDLSRALADPSRLLIAFTDRKPRSGPKSPHLLDQLLRTFSDTPLINASRIGESNDDNNLNNGDAHDDHHRHHCNKGFVCFDDAILGISANSYRMRPLVDQMKKNLFKGGENDDEGSHGHHAENDHDDHRGDAIRTLRVVYISRNHERIIRGRKVQNEEEFQAALKDELAQLEKTVSFLSSGGNTNKKKNMEKKAALRFVVEKVFMEEMTYAEQVRLAARTDIMLSPHGGGVANCIWMVPGSVMVEFVAPVGKTLPNMYHSMCTRSGISHFHFLANSDPSDEANRDPVFLSNKRLFSNMVVPGEMIRENVKRAVATWMAKNTNTRKS